MCGCSKQRVDRHAHEKRTANQYDMVDTLSAKAPPGKHQRAIQNSRSAEPRLNRGAIESP
jgi:hypothetical protein